MNNYISVIKKYAVFDGRAGRREYWMFFLFNCIIGLVLSLYSNISGDVHGVIGSIYSLALLVPGIAVAVRRLHDTGRSGWWCLIPLFPIVGIIWLIVLLCLDSNPGENKYGPSPKIVLPTITV